MKDIAKRRTMELADYIKELSADQRTITKFANHNFSMQENGIKISPTAATALQMTCSIPAIKQFLQLSLIHI